MKHAAQIVDGWPQHPSQEAEHPLPSLQKDILSQLRAAMKAESRGAFAGQLRIRPHPENMSIWYLCFQNLASPELEGSTVLASLSFYTRHRSCTKWHRHFPEHGPQFAVLTPTGIFSPVQGSMNVCMPGLTVGSQNEWKAAWDGTPSKGSQVKVLRRDGNGSVIHGKSKGGAMAKYDLQGSMVNWLQVMLGIFNVGLDVCFEAPIGGAVTSGGWLDRAATSYAAQRQCAEDSLRWNWEHHPKVCELLELPPPVKRDEKGRRASFSLSPSSSSSPSASTALRPSPALPTVSTATSKKRKAKTEEAEASKVKVETGVEVEVKTEVKLDEPGVKVKRETAVKVKQEPGEGSFSSSDAAAPRGIKRRRSSRLQGGR